MNQRVAVLFVTMVLAGCGVTIDSLEGKSPTERAQIVCADTPVIREAVRRERQQLYEAHEHEEAARNGYREVRECRTFEEQKAVTTTCTEADNSSTCTTEFETEDVRRCETVLIQVDRSYEERLARDAQSRANNERKRINDLFQWCRGEVIDLSPQAQVQWLRAR